MQLAIKFAIILLACITLIPPAQCGGGQPADTTAPELAQQHLQRGDEYFTLGRYDEAIDEYSSALAMDSELAQAYLGRGRAYHFGKELYSRAADDYSRAIELDPEYTDALYYRGLANMDNGACQRAIADLSTVIELAPGLAMPYYLRAWCNTHISQWDDTYGGESMFYVKLPQWAMLAAPDFIQSALPDSARQGNAPLLITPLNPDTEKGKYPQTPYIKMQPLSGPVGTKLDIYGWGFRANEDGMTVTWDDEIIMVNIRAETDGSLIIDGSAVLEDNSVHDGSTRYVIHVPPSTQGPHMLGVYGSSFTPRGIVESIAFEVLPALELSTEAHSQGTRITIEGTGFATEEAVTVAFKEMDTTVIATADNNGSFKTMEIVPAEKDREYTISASGDKGSTAQVVFTIASKKIVPPEQAPLPEEVYFNRGFARFKKAQWAQAIADLERSSVADATLKINREQALDKLQKWSDVVEDYSRVIALLGGTAPSPESLPLPSIEDELELAVADYTRAAELASGPIFAERAHRSAEFVEQWAPFMDN